jgi:hypothetical protein
MRAWQLKESKTNFGGLLQKLAFPRHSINSLHSKISVRLLQDTNLSIQRVCHPCGIISPSGERLYMHLYSMQCCILSRSGNAVHYSNKRCTIASEALHSWLTTCVNCCPGKLDALSHWLFFNSCGKAPLYIKAEWQVSQAGFFYCFM